MKRLLFLLLLTPLFASAQKIERDEVDRFTKARVKETNWNKLVYQGRHAIRVMSRRINDDVILGFMITEHKTLVVREGDYIMLLLDNDNAVKLPMASTKMSETNYGYQNKNNFDVLKVAVDPISQDDLKALSTHSLKAIRVYLSSDSPLEFDIAEKFKDAVKDCIKLVM